MNRSILTGCSNILSSCKYSVIESGYQKHKYSCYLIVLVLLSCAGCQTTPAHLQENISNIEHEESSKSVSQSIAPNATTPPLVFLHPATPSLNVLYPEDTEEKLEQNHSRLVAFQLQYKNPAKFQHYLNIVLGNKNGRCGQNILHLLAKGNSDHIILIDFPPECSGQIELSLSVCKPDVNLTLYPKCPSSEIYADKVLRIKIPDKNKLFYAGKLNFRLVDIYPHRGTANFPIYKQIDYTYEHNSSFDNYFGDDANINGYKLVHGKAQLTNRRKN